MKAGNDIVGVLQRAEEQAIEEPAQSHAASTGQDFGESHRVRGDTIHLKINFVSKPTAQTMRLAIQPARRA
jgi:hypothetical protein